MRILLAGAAGFIGSHLVDRLLCDGHEVVGVDNLITGRAANLAHLGDKARFTYVQADIIEPLEVAGPFDWVMHLASPASPPKYLAAPIETLRVNAEGTHHLLELARRSGAGFFLASTSEIYGDPLVHPQPESYRGNVSPIGPRSVYDEGKRFAEALTMANRRYHGMATRIVRIFNTYGPRMDPHDGRVVTNLIRQALAQEPLTAYGDGSQTRSFQYVDDLIEGIVRLLAVDYDGPVNLGNPDEFTILELAQLVRSLTATPCPIVFEALPEDDPRQRKPDIRLARRLLDWEPKVPLRLGLERTIEAMRETGW
jgi:nucleoside-diphosphate-sugar epimerase